MSLSILKKLSRLEPHRNNEGGETTMIDYNELRELMKRNRSVRRFDESRGVSRETLERLVELTRYCASGRNMQPLRYMIVDSADAKAKLFPLLAWAGYLKDWAGPAEGERPAAYLVQCLDTHYGSNCLCDDGLQLEAITLGMQTLGLGGCIIKAFNAAKLKAVFELEARFEPRYVLAVGYAAEQIELEDMTGGEDGDVKYYRTEDGRHHVPKRPAEELLIN